MTDSELNDLVHETADKIEKLVPGVTINRFALNDTLSAFLSDYGIHSQEDA